MFIRSKMVRVFMDQDGGEGKGGAGAATEGGEKTATEGEGTKTAQAKTFTQEQVNDLVTREKRREVEGFLKEIGFSDVKNAKEGLEKFKSWQESQRSDQEKTAERLKSIESELGAERTKTSTYEAQFEALKANVPVERAEKVAKLALSGVYEGETIAEKVAAVLKEFPEYATEKEDPAKKEKSGVRFGTETKKESQSEQQRLDDIIKANM